MQDLKAFRTLHSKTPGHPERTDYYTNKKNPGIEVTTGPLGQGIANGVGMAIAQQAMSTYDPQGLAGSNSRVYVICGDGCLMEGIASEACSLAGTKQLKNLTVLYDDNNITIDGRTSLAFAEDVKKRFEAYGWSVLEVADGNTDLEGIFRALETAQSSAKPTLIKVKTIIGCGAEKQDTHSVHGSPLGPEGVQFLKKHYGLPMDQYRISEETRQIFSSVVQQKEAAYAAWEQQFSAYSYRQQIDERVKFMAELSPERLAGIVAPALEQFCKDNANKATRQSSQAALQLLCDSALSKYMIIGAADLAPSCLTQLKNLPAPQYVYFGVREFAMCGISNGIAAHGSFVPFDATFLVFFNYCVGAIRVGALSRLGAVHVFTHDSIMLGDDGMTHQPVETLAQIRAMPGVYDWRPCDCQETLAAYAFAVGTSSRQHVMCLSRQNILLQSSTFEGTWKHGAYVLLENEAAEFTLLATGAEVEVAVIVAKKLGMRVVSMPSFKLFSEQEPEYQQKVLKFGRERVIAIEPFVAFGLERFAQYVVGIEGYGASAGAKELARFYEMDAEGVEKRVRAVIGK